MTLAEVVIAMALVVMVMAGAYTLVVVSARLTQSARDRYIATSLAMNRLERMKNLQYNDLPLAEEWQVIIDGNGAPTYYGDFRRSSSVDTNYGAYKTKVEVSVEIKNKITGQFDGSIEPEVVASIFADQLELGP